MSAGVGAARATARLPRRPAGGGPFRLLGAPCINSGLYGEQNIPPEFVISCQRAHEERRRSVEETFKGIIIDFQASSEFQQLRPKTRKVYTRYLPMVEQAFEDMPIAALDDSHPCKTYSVHSRIPCDRCWIRKLRMSAIPRCSRPCSPG
jgi:hypothetical protein